LCNEKNMPTPSGGEVEGTESGRRGGLMWQKIPVHKKPTTVQKKKKKKKTHLSKGLKQGENGAWKVRGPTERGKPSKRMRKGGPVSTQSSSVRHAKTKNNGVPEGSG